MKAALRLCLITALAIVAFYMMSCAPVNYEVKSVVYSPASANVQTFLYNHIQDVEFGYCNYGRVDGDTLRIERTELAFIVKSAPDSLYYVCTKQTLGMGHSHRKIHGASGCIFSDIDLRALIRGPYQYAFILCGGIPRDTAAILSIPISKRDAVELLKRRS